MLSVISFGMFGTSSATPTKTLSSPEQQRLREPKPGDLEDALSVLENANSSPDQIVGEIRRIAEIIVYAEQRKNQPILDLFFERNVTGTLRTMCLRPNVSNEVQIQILQTFSILAQCLKQETNLFHFLSQNHLNAVISHGFDFSNAPEELLAHYVSLLKTVALRMNKDLCQFFYDARTRESFPLYDKACEFFNSDEPLVRAAVRSVILMVHRVDDPDVDEYISRRQDFFKTMCDFIRQRFVRLKEFISRNDFDVNWLNKIEAGMSDTLDDYSFLQDILQLREERRLKSPATTTPRKKQQSGGEPSVLTPGEPTTGAVVEPEDASVDDITEPRNSFERILLERVLAPLLGDLEDHVSLWSLSQCCLVVKSPFILHRIYQSAFTQPQRSLFNNFASLDERLALASVTLTFFFIDRIPSDLRFVSRKKILSANSAAGSKPTYPVELVESLLKELIHRTGIAQTSRPVLVRILAKLLVHVTFDSRLLDSPLERFLIEEHSLLLRTAMRNAALKLKQVQVEPLLFIESFENEWRELKTGPLKVSSLLTNPSSVLPSPHLQEEDAEKQQRLCALLELSIPLSHRTFLNRLEETRSLANVFMVLRLCWASLEQAPDLFLPSVGNADVDSLREDSAIDLRRCEFLELQVLASTPVRLLLVLVAGALILVEPDNERRVTGMCRTVAPIHRIEVGSDSKDGSLLHLCIRSARRIGLAVRVGSKHEWCMSLRFDSEPKALFARDQIERAARRARDEKFARIQAMLDECISSKEMETKEDGIVKVVENEITQSPLVDEATIAKEGEEDAKGTAA